MIRGILMRIANKEWMKPPWRYIAAKVSFCSLLLDAQPDIDFIKNSNLSTCMDLHLGFQLNMQNMQLAEYIWILFKIYQPHFMHIYTSASGTDNVSWVYILSVLYTHLRNLTGSTQSTQIVSWKCSCRRDTGQPAWSFSLKNISILVLLREEKEIPHFPWLSLCEAAGGWWTPESPSWQAPDGQQSCKIRKKHRHRRNVTSHHSFSLLWQS